MSGWGYSIRPRVVKADTDYYVGVIAPKQFKSASAIQRSLVHQQLFSYFISTHRGFVASHNLRFVSLKLKRAYDFLQIPGTHFPATCQDKLVIWQRTVDHLIQCPMGHWLWWLLSLYSLVVVWSNWVSWDRLSMSTGRFWDWHLFQNLILQYFTSRNSPWIWSWFVTSEPIRTQVHYRHLVVVMDRQMNILPALRVLVGKQ